MLLRLFCFLLLSWFRHRFRHQFRCNCCFLRLQGMCKKKFWFFADDEITDRRTDRTSYRDARAHLNIARKITINESINYLKDWNNNINSHARYFFMHSLAPSSSLPSPLSILWMWHCCTSSDKSRLMPYLFNCDSRHIENWPKIFHCPTSSGAI